MSDVPCTFMRQTVIKQLNVKTACCLIRSSQCSIYFPRLGAMSGGTKWPAVAGDRLRCTPVSRSHPRALSRRNWTNRPWSEAELQRRQHRWHTLHLYPFSESQDSPWRFKHVGLSYELGTKTWFMGGSSWRNLPLTWSVVILLRTGLVLTVQRYDPLSSLRTSLMSRFHSLIYGRTTLNRLSSMTRRSSYVSGNEFWSSQATCNSRLQL